MRSSSCSICSKTSLAILNQIDKQLRDGTPVSTVARAYNLSRSSLQRHFAGKHHELPPVRDPEAEPETVARTATELTELEDLSPREAMAKIIRVVNHIESIVEEAKAHGLTRGVLEAAKVLSTIMATLAKMKGWISDGNQINIQVNAQIKQVGNEILAVLQDYPEARDKLLEVLTRGERLEVTDVTPEYITGMNAPSSEQLDRANGQESEHEGEQE